MNGKGDTENTFSAGEVWASRLHLGVVARKKGCLSHLSEIFRFGRT